MTVDPVVLDGATLTPGSAGGDRTQQRPGGALARRSAGAAERLDPDLSDRALHPDVEAARLLLEDWSSDWPG